MQKRSLIAGPSTAMGSSLLVMWSRSSTVFLNGGALNTYGLDAGYFITPVLKASIGYYYQHRDQEDVDGSGVRGRLAYEISNGLTAGVNVSYDQEFDTRVSADLKVRFGGASTTAQRKAVQQLPVINSLTSTPSNRDVRVHDSCGDILWEPIWDCY